MEHLTKKKELIEWLLHLDDDTILNKITKLKNQSQLNFDREFEDGLSMDDFKAEIFKRIKTYSLRK